jgi:hypothetical protein
MLRSGKEFSVFDLALARVITPPMDFDFGAVLQERLAEEALTDMLDEDPTTTTTTTTQWTQRTTNFRLSTQSPSTAIFPPQG